MLYFLKKAGKIAKALGAPPQTPVGLRRLGALAPLAQTSSYATVDWMLTKHYFAD